MPNATNDEPADEQPLRIQDDQAVENAPYARGRAEASGIVLTEADAEIVKGMLRRGDRQQDIAAWFGVNQARVSHIETGQTFLNAPVASNDRLPPPGPYPGWRAAATALDALREAKRAIAEAERIILNAKDQ